MTPRILPWIAATALLGAVGCGSDDEDNEQAATATTPAVGQITTATTEDRVQTTTAEDNGADGGELSPEGRAVLAATEDLAADISETAQEFAEGSIDDEEATARLELARDRAADLRARAEKLPATDRARSRLVSLNEEIGQAATDVSGLASAGRAASRDDIETRLNELRDDARAAFDDVRELLDRPAQERFREALDRIGVKAPG